MNKSYDKTIRSLLKDLPVTFMELLTGKKLSKDTLKLLDIKLQKVIEREADLIVENTETGDIYYVEFQSTNDPSMPVRMAIYFILQNYRKAPKQFLVYVGRGKCTMSDHVEIGNSKHSYKVIDIKKDIDCHKLLESPNPNDWVLSILCRIDPEGRVIRRALGKIKSVKDRRKQQELIQKLLILAGLREEQILKLVEQEVRTIGLVINPETNIYLKQLVEKGELEAKKEDILSLYKELHLPSERIARILKVSEEFAKEVLSEAGEL